jgi:hypothetical protein
VARVNAVIESFLQDEFGTPTSFDPGGIAFDAAGIPMMGEGGVVKAQYRVYYSPTTYTYQVWILNSVSPDLISLTRELLHITPSGMAFTIDNTKANILNYGNWLLNMQPALYAKLGADYNDYSGHANNGTAFGTIAVLASPGLLITGMDGVDGGRDFNGTTGYVTFPDQPYYDFHGAGGYMVLARIDALPSAGNIGTIFSKGTGALSLAVNENGALVAYKEGSNAIAITANGVVTTGIKYHISITHDGTRSRIYLNGIELPVTLTLGQLLINNANAFTLGRRVIGSDMYFNGVLDEFAAYSRKLYDDEIYAAYKVSMNIAT